MVETLAKFCSDCGKKLVVDQYGFSMGCDNNSCAREQNRKRIRDLKAREGTKQEVKVEVKHEPLIGGLRHDAQGGHLVKSKSEWTYDQRELSKKLGLSDQARKYLGRICTRCGKPCPPNAKLDLCVEHSKEHQREYIRQYMREYRKRVKGK